MCYHVKRDISLTLTLAAPTQHILWSIKITPPISCMWVRDVTTCCKWPEALHDRGWLQHVPQLMWWAGSQMHTHMNAPCTQFPPRWELMEIECTLHSSTHSGWTPDGLRISTWTPYGLHLQYNQRYIFHDHPPESIWSVHRLCLDSTRYQWPPYGVDPCTLPCVIKENLNLRQRSCDLV